MHEGDEEHVERIVDVGMVTRVEGEGSLHLRVVDGRVEDVRLSIFEAPRYFEKLVCGRTGDEVIDIVARICGICPVAYQMSAVHAFERLYGVEVHPSVRALRRLMYCGEWLESHALHVYLLHAPDFLGHDSVVSLARAERATVERGLALKRTGNRILELLGGRAIHPVSVRVGGFSRTPTRAQLDALAPDLDAAVTQAEETLAWVGGFPVPGLFRDVHLVSLRGDGEYPMNHGRIVSTDGTDVDPWAWDAAFAESQAPHSHALHARTGDGGTYQVGPPARGARAGDDLHPEARAALERSGLAPVIRMNPFWSVAARAVELLHAAHEARDVVAAYEAPAEPRVPWAPREGVAAWSTEAPRGLLFHRYVVDGDGFVQAAQIVPPTSQNQGMIEEDLARFAPGQLALPDDALARSLEGLVRSFDPCISCATHFLDVTVERA